MIAATRTRSACSTVMAYHFRCRQHPGHRSSRQECQARRYLDHPWLGRGACRTRRRLGRRGQCQSADRRRPGLRQNHRPASHVGDPCKSGTDQRCGVHLIARLTNDTRDGDNTGSPVNGHGARNEDESLRGFRLESRKYDRILP
jgi:hypothetical protein